MLQFILSIVISVAAYAGDLDTPVRAGLGFGNEAARPFTDENILSSVRYAVENSHVAPVHRIKLDGAAEKLSVVVIGDGEAEQFAFKIEGGQPVHQAGPLTETILHQVDIPFGHLQSHGIHQMEGMSYSSTAAWIAVGVVGVYAAKKVLNKITIGRYSAGGGDHDHSLFPQPAEMRAEMAENRELMERAVARAEEAMDGQLLEIVKPLAKAAACGHHHDHDHHHGLGHKHAPSGFQCEAIDEPKAAAARQSLLRAFPNYAARFGKDFYEEIISPVVGLVKAVKNKDTRKQIWNFFDLISRRMVRERGMGAAVATGVFVGTGQVIIELLESFVMPAGAHMFCQVGNAAVLAFAAKAYTAYFCMTRNEEFKDKSWTDRWRVSQDISRLSKLNAEPKSAGEKLIHALNLMFRLVERDLRHARNLENIEVPESRELARRLGDLRRDLTVLSIRLINGTAADGEALSWLRGLYEVQSTVHDCSEALAPAA